MVKNDRRLGFGPYLYFYRNREANEIGVVIEADGLL